MRMGDFWRRFIVLGVATVVHAVVTRPGAEPSDRTVALALLTAVAAAIWVMYPVFARFFQVEPTRMTIEEYVVGAVGLGALGVTISYDPPSAVGLACAVVGSAVLSFESATLLERATRCRRSSRSDLTSRGSARTQPSSVQLRRRASAGSAAPGRG